MQYLKIQWVFLVELMDGEVFKNKQMLVFVDEKVSSIRISEKYRSNFEHKNN